jgi:hypothetical protein
VIHFLIASEALVDLTLDVAARPHDCKFLISLSCLSETIILQDGSDKSRLHIVVHLEIVTTIRRLVGADAYRVYVWTETHVLLIQPILESLGLSL